MVRLRMLLFACAVAIVSPATLFAALHYSSIGQTHNEDFDTLESTGTSISWLNDSTLPNWYLYRVPSASTPGPPVAIAQYSAGDGSSEHGDFYSFGMLPNDRAIGAIGHANFGNYFGFTAGIPVGGVIGWIAMGVTNNTGSELTQFTANFAGEQWRDGDTAAQPRKMTFEYGFGASFDVVSSWTAPGDNFDWETPVANGTLLAVNGNEEGRVENRGGTIDNLAWGSGSTLWMRWVERNDLGADPGLAIDDFSFSAHATVPEPGSVVFGGLCCTFAVVVIAVRRFVASLRQRP